MKYHTPLIDFEEYSEATKSFGEKIFFLNSFDKYWCKHISPVNLRIFVKKEDRLRELIL